MRLFEDGEKISKQIRKHSILESISLGLTLLMLVAVVIVPGSLSLAGLIIMAWLNINMNITKQGWEIALYVLANRVTLVQQVTEGQEAEEDVPLMSAEEVARQRRMQELEAELQALKEPVVESSKSPVKGAKKK